jgi:hypothetical protein
METTQLLLAPLPVEIPDNAVHALGVVVEQLYARKAARLEGVVAHDFRKIAPAPLDPQAGG